VMDVFRLLDKLVILLHLILKLVVELYLAFSDFLVDMLVVLVIIVHFFHQLLAIGFKLLIVAIQLHVFGVEEVVLLVELPICLLKGLKLL
jgi:hypothetical protein